MKLCKNCEHYTAPHFSGKCSISEYCSVRIPGREPEFDPVTGREDLQLHNPRSMRSECGECGPEARLFKEKFSILRRLIG